LENLIKGLNTTYDDKYPPLATNFLHVFTLFANYSLKPPAAAVLPKSERLAQRR
jgi:hypothetical protein